MANDLTPLKNLNARQAAFVAEYVSGGNAHQAALAAGYAEGTARVAGVPLAKINRDAAAERAEALRSVFAELAGMSTHVAAAELDKRGIATPTGAKWSAMTVLRVRKRLAT